MGRLSDTYCIVGPGPFTPRQEVYRETVQYALEDSARFYRAQAKQAARVTPDEAEVPDAKAAILEAALVVLLEDGLPLAALREPKPGPQEHFCDECGGFASNGFGDRHQAFLWACGAHKDIVAARWHAEKTEREKRAAAILEKTETSLAGVVPGLLI